MKKKKDQTFVQQDKSTVRKNIPVIF